VFLRLLIILIAFLWILMSHKLDWVWSHSYHTINLF